MTDVWNAAWEEAEASIPPTVDIYCTLELQHIAFVDAVTGPFAVRAVAGTHNDTTCGIEEGATLDPDSWQVFKAIPFYSERPEFSQGKTPECRIVVDCVGDELIPYLEAATLVRSDMVCIYREYRSDDMSEPCYGPVQFLIKQVTLRSSTIEGVAKIDDLVNRKFPSRVYSYEDYPGLSS